MRGGPIPIARWIREVDMVMFIMSDFHRLSPKGKFALKGTPCGSECRRSAEAGSYWDGMLFAIV